MALLDNAKSMMGPLDPERKRAIYAYLQNPTPEGWDLIHCIVINWKGPHRTVWQALTALDPSYTHIGRPHNGGTPASERWARIPDGLTLARAIKQVLDNP